jgi:hypothetical protein
LWERTTQSLSQRKPQLQAAANTLIFSGKSYELVSFAAQQPDATVFQPSGSEMKPGMMEFHLLL